MSQPIQKGFLLVAPLIVLPFLCGIFAALGGGKGKGSGVHRAISGLNLELPEAFSSVRKPMLDKLGAYQRADADSMRKREAAQQDPYRPVVPVAMPAVRRDSMRRVGADELLAQLSRLRASLQQPEARSTPVRESSPLPPPLPPPISRDSHRRVADTGSEDPQLERLNRMLDKVIRIQHPSEDKPVGDRGETRYTEQLVPADSTANAIAAVIPENETLVNGGSLPLRLTDPVRLRGTVIAAGTWVYGTVSFHNDRMMVQIRSLRLGNNIYPADLQVYDLDGMPGIHIPVRLSQEVVKESADESVAGLNVLTAEASWEAQAANAGVQAGKSLLGRRVRQVRVSVRAGYAVLLRNGGASRERMPVLQKVGSSAVRNEMEPPSVVPEGRHLERVRGEGLELGLRGVYLEDSLLWLALSWRNKSAIGYIPGFYRWIIRDRRHFRRMAQQELPLEPLSGAALRSVPGDSVLGQWVAFRAFALGTDKELVLQVGEKDGGRSLELVIPPRVLLNAKTVQHEKEEEATRQTDRSELWAR